MRVLYAYTCGCILCAMYIVLIKISSVALLLSLLTFWFLEVAEGNIKSSKLLLLLWEAFDGLTDRLSGFNVELCRRSAAVRVATLLHMAQNGRGERLRWMWMSGWRVFYVCATDTRTHAHTHTPPIQGKCIDFVVIMSSIFSFNHLAHLNLSVIF